MQYNEQLCYIHFYTPLYIISCYRYLNWMIITYWIVRNIKDPLPLPARTVCTHLLKLFKKNIFKNIHSKLGSVKIQVRMSCSARTNFAEIIYPSFEAKVMNPKVPLVSRLCCNPGKSIQDGNAHNSQKPRSIISFLSTALCPRSWRRTWAQHFYF